MKFLFVILFLLSIIPSFSFGQTLDGYPKLAKEAEELFNEKKYNEAIPYYNQLIRLRPNYFFNYMMKGRALYFIGEVESAFEHLSVAIKKDPNKAEIYYYRSLFYSIEAFDEKATNDIKKALSLDNENIEYLFSAARYSSKAGYYERAIKLYEKIIQKDFSNPDIYYFTGISYLILGDSTNALKNLKLAMNMIQQSEPTDGTDMLKTAILSALGKEEDALNNSLSIIAKKPEEPYGYVYASDSYRIFKQWDKALEMLNKANKIKGNDSYILTQKAYFLVELDSFNQSKNILDKLLESNPNSYNALVTKAYLHIKLNQTDSVLQLLNTAIKIRPNHPSAYKIRAQYYFAINETLKGCEEIQIAISRGYQRMYNNGEAKELIDEYCN